MTHIQLIWDFRGGNSKGTAQHHVVHLKEFMTREGIEHHGTGIQEHSELWCSAWLNVNEADMLTVRDALKPHRGLKVEAD